MLCRLRRRRRRRGAGAHGSSLGADEDDAGVGVAHVARRARAAVLGELVARVLAADAQRLLVGLVIAHTRVHGLAELPPLLPSVAGVLLAVRQLAGEEVALAIVEDVGRGAVLEFHDTRSRKC